MEEYIQWLEQQIERCLNDKDLQREHWAFCKAYEKFTALHQPHDSGSLPLDLVKVIASKSYRQGCFHLDDMDAGMRQFEKWYESEIKELRSSGK